MLLAYAKLSLHDELLASRVPDDPYLARELERYFPAEMRERFPDAIAGHRLRREIIATQLANAIINRGGPTIVTRLVDQTGADAPTIAAAYAATRDSFGLTDLNAAIDALDGKVRAHSSSGSTATLQDLLMSRIVWFIRNVDFNVRSLDAVVGTYRHRHCGGRAQPLRDAVAAGPGRLARARPRIVGTRACPRILRGASRLCPISSRRPTSSLVAQRTGRPVPDIARTHFALEALFRLGALVGAAREISVSDYFDRLALDRAIDSVASAHRNLTAEAAATGLSGAEAVTAWSERRGADLARIRAAVDAIVGSGLNLSKVTVAASLLGDLARG